MGVHYQRFSLSNQTNFICGSHEISKSILTLTPQNYHNNHISIYTFDPTSHCFHGKPLPGNIPPYGSRNGSHVTRKRTQPPGECHFVTTQKPQTDLKLPNQNRLFGLTIIKNLRIKGFASTEPTSVSTEPSVACAEAKRQHCLKQMSGSYLWYYFIPLYENICVI